MTEFEKLTVPCRDAEGTIKKSVGLTTYNQIESLVKSSNLDMDIALNFTANVISELPPYK